jgi:hypothetical protein
MKVLGTSFIANPAIVQLYHGENKLIFNKIMISDNVRFVLDQHA